MTKPRGLKRDRPVILRLSDEEITRVITMVPEMMNPENGGIRYGGWSRYFLGLMRQDLERRTQEAMKVLNANPRQ